MSPRWPDSLIRRACGKYSISRVFCARWPASPAPNWPTSARPRDHRSASCLAYLTAAVVDQDNTPVPGASVPITFTSYGPGELLPQTWPGHATGFTWNAIAGMTRIAFRSTARTGDSVISAYSPGLAMGRTIVKVTSPGKPSEMDYQERFAEDETPVILKAQ